jgi:hypothetical protein
VLGASLALGSASSSVARAELLYDLDFGTPPHTVGLPPVIGSGPAPRETVTDIPFGDPRVATDFLVLLDQPMRLDTADGNGDQIELDVEDLATCGVYTFACELVVGVCEPNQELTFLFDTPEVRNIHFEDNGDISAFVPGEVIGVIGSYTLGDLVALEVVIDLPADEWTITVDGVELFTGPFGGATALTAIRVSTDVLPPIPLIRAAIDNVTLEGSDCLAPDACDRISFNDLPLGQQYEPGEEFVSSNVVVSVSDHWVDVGACGGNTASGFAEVANDGLACQVAKEINVNNVTLEFDFGQTVTDVLIPFGEYGGTVSLSVNGECAVVENFADLSGTGMGGVLVTVFDNGPPGQSCGVIRLGGEVTQLAIGGQELFIDGITYCPHCPSLARSAFEDQTLGASFEVDDSFTSGAATHTFADFYSPDATCSTPFSDGVATIGNGQLACTDGKELQLNNINDRIDFGGPVDRLLLAFGEYGGNVNLQINGECRNVANFSDVSNQLVGGVHVRVEEFGDPGQSCGALYAEGTIEEFVIGGQELWIDNVRVCAPVVGVGEDGAPARAHAGLLLEQSRPNPLRAGTAIRFSLLQAGTVNLAIYDVAGRLVRTLASGPLGAGGHEVWWDGTNERGRRVAPGFYSYRLETGGGTSARRLIVLP